MKHVEQLRRNSSWQKCFAMPTRAAAGGAPTAKSPSLSVMVYEQPNQARPRVTTESIATPPKGTSSTNEQPAVDRSLSRHVMNTTASVASDPVTAALAVAIAVAALAARRVLERKPAATHDLPHS